MQRICEFSSYIVKEGRCVPKIKEYYVDIIFTKICILTGTLEPILTEISQ